MNYDFLQEGLNEKQNCTFHDSQLIVHLINLSILLRSAGVQEFFAFAQQHVRSSDNSPATINLLTRQLVNLST